MDLKPAAMMVKKADRSVIGSSLETDRNHNLSLYTTPPMEVISLEEFEEMGRMRLKVLRKIEQLNEKYSKGSEEYVEAFKKEISPIMPLATGRCFKEQLPEARRHDRISHFILRMAFCQSAEQARWFLQLEIDLFRMRFRLEKDSDKLDFLRGNQLDLEQVSVAEKIELSSALSQASSMTEEKVAVTDFWKVHFSRATELVRARRVLLLHGFIYITINELAAVVASRLRLIMSKSMAREAQGIAFLQEDDRLLPLLKRMVKASSSSYTKPAHPNEITPEMVDDLARTSFPPCMRSIHHSLRQDHHLRHFARRQYGLFLKDAGLSMESALSFFRAEFTKKVDPDRFAKDYAYNIRHMYGKEGSHREGRGMPCSMIVNNSVPGAQDCHGCPFKHCEPDVLAQRLEAMGIGKDDVRKALAYSKSNQFDRACTRVFEAQHRMDEGGLGQLITHPNQYFDLSRQIHAGKRTAASATHEIHASVKREAS